MILATLGEDDMKVELNKRSGVELSTPLHEAAMLDQGKENNLFNIK